MGKLILLLLSLFSYLLIAETVSESEYRKIVEKSLSTINQEYFLIDKNSSDSKGSLTPEITNFEKNRYSIPYEDAVVKAQQEDKIVLLEVVLNNCKFCEKMEKEVLSKDNIQEDISKNFVFTQINADRETIPLGLSEQMSPMYVFISKNENVKDMRFGYMNEDDFLKLLVEESKK